MSGRRTGQARLGVESLEGRDVTTSLALGAVWWQAADIGGAVQVGQDSAAVEKKGGGTKGGGKVTFQDFHFTAKMSKSSPL
ncbi:MAG: hypothetical protein K2X82_08145 [Gemmataceae bacterium]|nr:hypothetical protein [Gemmataceae bacterium]